MATNRTFAEVFTRARALLNDQSGSYWTDARLLEFAKSAYTWAGNEIGKLMEVATETIATGLVYTANTENISAILPADFYLPKRLRFRVSTSEEWQEVDRKDEFISRETNQLSRVIEWRFLNRTIHVNKSTNGGLFELTYMPVMTVPTGASSNILFDNIVEALGHATASLAYGSRGQRAQAAFMWGDRNNSTQGPNGAIGFMDQVTDMLVKNLQLVPRRGAAFSSRGPIPRTYAN